MLGDPWMSFLANNVAMCWVQKCTPPKTNDWIPPKMVLRKAGGSFKNMASLGIYVRFLVCIPNRYQHIWQQISCRFVLVFLSCIDSLTKFVKTKPCQTHLSGNPEPLFFGAIFQDSKALFAIDETKIPSTLLVGNVTVDWRHRFFCRNSISKCFPVSCLPKLLSYCVTLLYSNLRVLSVSGFTDICLYIRNFCNSKLPI